MNNTLNVSEMFYSIQGEGKTMGIPAIFLRLQACNLLCNWKKNGIDHPCDTIPVWRQGTKMTFEEIISHLKEKGWLNALFMLDAHLIITGGEPLLQQENVSSFIETLQRLSSRTIFVEIETNATITPCKSFSEQVMLFNTSPKLSNSSMSEKRRYNADTLAWHADNSDNNHLSIFKFVVNDERDVEEVLRDFVERWGISCNRVYLMPEGVTREELNHKRQWVAELCKKYGFRFSDRLQVSIWEQVTGV